MQALSDPPDALWRTIVGVYLTTRQQLVTVVELARDATLHPVRPLVLAAEIHADWSDARAWLGSGISLLPRLDEAPDLREALDGTLGDVIERVARWMREAGCRDHL